ncbi:hypothetical protein D3C81_1879190 [compost metagenome]
MSASNVAFTRHAIADFKTFHFLADADYFADILMPNNHWNRDGFLRPFIPVINVNVSPADGCFTDFNQQIVMTDFRFRNVGHPNAFFRFQFG